MAEIRSVEGLRAALGEPRATTKAKLLDHLDEQALEFLEVCPFAALATCGGDGLQDVSPKGDVPGFVLVEDPRTIVLPDRAGNNLAFGLEDIIENPGVGVLFLRPGTGETLRISGQATIIDDADVLERLAAHDKPPKLAIRVEIQRAFFHCARSVIRAGLWKPETWPERQKVSFGRIIAAQTDGGSDVAEEIDTRVDAGYQTTADTESPAAG